MARFNTIEDLKNINTVLTDEEKKFILEHKKNISFDTIERLANKPFGKLEQMMFEKYMKEFNEILEGFNGGSENPVDVNEKESETEKVVDAEPKQAPKYKNGDKVHCAIYNDNDKNETEVFEIIGEPTIENGEYVYYVSGDGQHYVKESLVTPAESAEKVEYPTEVYEKADIDCVTKPNPSIQKICEVFTLSQLQKLFGGFLAKSGDSLNLKNIRVKGWFVQPKIAMDAVTEDYAVTCFSRPTDKDTKYSYEDVNKSVIDKVTSLMWQFAKGEISPIKLGETWVDIINSDGKVGEMEAEDVTDKKKKPYKTDDGKKEKGGEVFVEKYKPTKREIDICTIEESVEKFNPQMTDDEIRGYVFYKRCLGVPMNGWEKWFLKRDDENGMNLGDFVYAVNHEVKPVSDYAIPAFYSGQFIGVLLRETKNFVFVLDNMLQVVAFDREEVVIRENKVKFDRKEVDALLGNGLFVRDFNAPKSVLKRNIFIPNKLQRNDNRRFEILQIDVTGGEKGTEFKSLFFNYDADGVFSDSQTGQIKLKLENIFSAEKDDEGNIVAYTLPRTNVDLFKLFYNKDSEGRVRAKKGFGKKKDMEKDDPNQGILYKCETLVPSYDHRKLNSATICDYIYGFYGKNGKMYLIPYYAVDTTPIDFGKFLISIFVPKSEFLRGNLRKLLKTYIEKESVTIEEYNSIMNPSEKIDILVPKNAHNKNIDEYEDEEEEQSGDAPVDNMRQLPTMQEKYNEMFADLSLGTLQKKIIEDEIKQYITTYDFKASLESGLRPYISIDSHYAKRMLVREIDGQPVGDIINAYSNNKGNFEDGQLFALKDAFREWFTYLYDEYELRLGVTKKDIIDMITVGRLRAEADTISSSFRMSNAIAELDRIFSDFIANNVDADCVKVLNELYNEEESCISPNLYNYTPFGFSANKSVFSSSAFELNKAQTSGLRFLANNGSGLLMHDVGFGKTLTAIHNLAVKMSSGEISRAIVCVPKMVYANWAKEMFGCWRTDNNQIIFSNFGKNKFESGVLSGTDVNLFLLGNGSFKQTADEANESGALSSLFSQNFKLYDSSWRFVRNYTIEEVNRGLLPQNTIILCTHEAVGDGKVSFTDSLTRKTLQEICHAIVSSIDKGSGFLEKCYNGKLKNFVGFDAMGADYFVMDEFHNAKGLLKANGRISGVSQRSTLAVRTFLATTYFSTFYGNNVNLLSATPFTNAVMEIITSLIMTNVKKWFFEVPQNTISKFNQSFIQLTYEVKIKHSLEIDSEWCIGKFKNRKVLKDIVFGFINYNFDSKNAGICRPTKLNYPSKVVDTNIGETALARSIRKIIMEILKFEPPMGQTSLKSLFVMRIPIYNSKNIKKWIAEGKQLPNISDFSDKDKGIRTLYSPKFIEWYEAFLKISEGAWEEWKKWGVYSKFTTSNQKGIVIEKEEVGTIDEAWKVYDFEKDTTLPKLHVDKTFTVLSLMQSLSICPYFVTPNMNGYSVIFEDYFRKIIELNSVNNVSLDNFMSNCGKIEYVTNCIKSVKEYHEKNNETIIENTRKQLIIDLAKENMTKQEKEAYIKEKLENIPPMSGQVVYIGRGIKPFDEIQDSEEWSDETKAIYKGKNLLQLAKKYIMDKCGFGSGVKIGRKTYDEVEIISGDTSDIDRKNIQDLFQNGKIHVIIGTSSIREGINLQKRSTALYVCSIDWNPTDFQQLEGRIWRQGNEFQFVRIVTPLVQNTLDSFIYQKVGEKMKRIESIFDTTKSNIIDVTFDVSVEELKFHVMDDVDELTKMHKSQTLTKLKTLIIPSLSMLKQLIGHYEGSGSFYDDNLTFFEGILNAKNNGDVFHKKLVEFYSAYKKFLEDALNGVDDFMREKAQEMINGEVEWFKDARGDCEITSKPVTNLEDRKIYNPKRDAEGHFVKDEKGDPIREEKIIKGIFSSENYNKFIERLKSYIEDIDNFIKKADDGNITSNDIPTNAMFTYSNIAMMQGGQYPSLNISFEYEQVTYDDEGNQKIIRDKYTNAQRIPINAEDIAERPTFEKFTAGEKTYYDLDSVILAYKDSFTNTKRIAKKLGITKDTSTKDLYVKRNDILIKLVGDGDGYLEVKNGIKNYIKGLDGNQEKTDDEIDYIVEELMSGLIASLFGNKKNFVLFNNAVNDFHDALKNAKSGGATDALGNSYDDDEEQNRNYLNSVHGKEITNDDAVLTQYFEYLVGLKDMQLKAEMSAELARRNRNLGNAREVAMFFAKYNYIISEKFGREKHGILPNYTYNDDSILGVQPTRKIYLPDDNSDEAVLYKLLKIRDFIPFAQYNKIALDVDGNAQEINNTYLNIYSIFATKDKNKECLRYYNPKSQRGFFVLSRGFQTYEEGNELVKNTFFEDLTDENFTTQEYMVKPFVISGNKDLVLDDEVEEKGDFSRETEYLMDFTFKTKADFDGKSLYTLENKKNEEKCVKEEEEQRKLNSDLDKLLAELKKVSTSDIEPVNITKMTIQNVAETIGTVANNLDSETYDLLDRFNEKSGVFTQNVLVRSIEALAFGDENLEKILEVIHILNLLVGIDDTADIDRIKYERARIQREEKERIERENRIIEEYKNAEGIIKETKENTEKTDKTSDADSDKARRLRLIKIRAKAYLYKKNKLGKV